VADVLGDDAEVGFTTTDGSVSNPSASTSLTSAGKGAAVACIASAQSRSTRFNTNSLLRATLAGVSFGWPGARSPGPNATTGGLFPITLKKL